VDIAGITVHPDVSWMRQIARNVTMEGCGALRDCRYLLHDLPTSGAEGNPHNGGSAACSHNSHHHTIAVTVTSVRLRCSGVIF
jgi:hypothetical protein